MTAGFSWELLKLKMQSKGYLFSSLHPDLSKKETEKRNLSIFWMQKVDLRPAAQNLKQSYLPSLNERDVVGMFNALGNL